MFPSIISTHVSELGSFHLLSTGRVAAAYEIKAVDLETADLEAVDAAVARVLRALPTKAVARFWLQSEADDTPPVGCSRAPAIHAVGYVQSRWLITVELPDSKSPRGLLARFIKQGPDDVATIQLLAAALDRGTLEAAGFQVKSLPTEEFEELLVNSLSGAISLTKGGVEIGHELIGIIRLVKQGSHALTLETLAQIKDSLPLPFEMRVSVKRVAPDKAEALLRRRSGQVKQGNDTVSASKLESAQLALEEVALGGSSLFQVEWIVTLTRRSEERLRVDAEEVVQRLKPLGDVYFESFGALPSFIAAQVGQPQHQTFLETEEVLTAYLPLFTYGDGLVASTAPSGANGDQFRGLLMKTDQQSHVQGQGRGREQEQGHADTCMYLDQMFERRTMDVTGDGGRYDERRAKDDGRTSLVASTAPSGANGDQFRGLLSSKSETSGNGSRTAKPVERTSLVLHRRDQTLSSVDLFDSKLDNFSACIFGKSGRGKSVLTNLLTRALMNDPRVRVIKVDVGGSHSKETELLGGEERRLSLSEPSGINPFSALAGLPHSEEVCNIIAAFVGVLLLEEGETILSKQLRGEIEAAVTAYSLLRPSAPSLSDFYERATELPRRALLARWTGRGVYRNAFAVEGAERGIESSVMGLEARGSGTGLRLGLGVEADAGCGADRRSRPDAECSADAAAVCSAESQSRRVADAGISPRLRYYNFAGIMNAADPDFAQGAMAAVIADFNLKLLNASGGERLVFIVDETPFFIERCFSFFKLSTANVRKFGGSFIVIAQKSSDVVIGGDTGILDNTATKFLFSVDGERDTFARRLKLTNDVVSRVEELESQKGVFSEVLVTDSVHGSKTMRIILSREEYWATTSAANDNEKLCTLLQAVPELTRQQAITVLSQIHDQR